MPMEEWPYDGPVYTKRELLAFLTSMPDDVKIGIWQGNLFHLIGDRPPYTFEINIGRARQPRRKKATDAL